MDYEFDETEQAIDRCYCCDNWVRRKATREVRVGERYEMERWCIGCIEEVDEFTLSLTNADEELPAPDIDI